MSLNNKPNETTDNLDEIRRNRLRQAVQSDKSEENNENYEKELDIDNKSSYIAEDVDSTEDEETQKLKNYIEKTFNGDELKVAKSLLSSQSEYSKLYNKYKEIEKYKELIEADPNIKELFDSAQSVDDIKNLIAKEKEPEGKPTSQSIPSKPNDAINVSVEELKEKGYLRNYFFDELNDADKDAVIRQAELKYIQNELPNILAERTVVRAQQRIDEMEQQRKEKEQQEKNKAIIADRYEAGVSTVVEKYGLDFANNEEDRKLLDEIDRRASYIRDPENPNVIDADAVEIATRKVLQKYNRLEEQLEKGATEKQNLDKFKGDSFNVNKKQPKQPREPLTVAEKLRQRRLERYQSNIERGAPIRKSEVIKV